MALRVSTTPTILANLDARLVKLERAALYLTRGRATLQTGIGVGASVPVTLVFDKAVPDTGYDLTGLWLENPTGLGSLFPVGPLTAKAVDGCTIQVKNTSLVSIGSGATVVAGIGMVTP